MIFDGATRPIRALMAAQHYNVSFAYASALLKIMDALEAGQLTPHEFIQAGQRLGERYPEEFKHVRGLFEEKQKGTNE